MLRQTLLLLVGAGAQLCWGNPISAANAHSLWNGKGEMVPGKAFDRFITIWLENQVRAWMDESFALSGRRHSRLEAGDFERRFRGDLQGNGQD